MDKEEQGMLIDLAYAKGVSNRKLRDIEKCIPDIATLYSCDNTRLMSILINIHSILNRKERTIEEAVREQTVTLNE